MRTYKGTDIDFSKIIFYGTPEEYRQMREEQRRAEVEGSRDPTLIATYEPDYTITTTNEPHEEVVVKIQENKAVEQLLSTDSDILYSYKQQIKTTILYVNHGRTIHKIKNLNPNRTCANVEGDKIDDYDAQHKYFQCETCEKFFHRISEFKEHLVKVNVCNTCQRQFGNYAKYVLHCLGHSNPDRECSACLKVLANKYSLKKHKATCKKITNLRDVRKVRREIPPKTASN